jgi:transcriptional regulator with XRE-family HTH domain
MIRERIQDAIRDTGLSQREVSRVTGIDETLLSRFNRGLREMSFETIDRLMNALGLEIVIRPRCMRKYFKRERN